MAEQNRGCLFAFLRLLGLRGEKPTSPLPRPAQDTVVPQPVQAPPEATELPYRLEHSILHRSERAFYHSLRQAVGDRLVICPKVRLADIFFDQSPGYHWFNKIAYKHVDFLLCDPATFKPLLGIELDDASHQRPDRIARDEFVEQVFQVAKLPLMRLPVQINYEVHGLKAQIDRRIATAPAQPLDPQPQQDPLTPLCPKCGAIMVVRTVRRGDKQGQKFYGCTTYPTCTGTFPFDAA
jgi:hypothetical protein